MTDGVEQWILDLPVWVQTPLVLVVLVVVAAVVAVAMLKLATVLPPLTDEEKQAFQLSDDDPVDEGENR